MVVGDEMSIYLDDLKVKPNEIAKSVTISGDI